VVGVSRFNQRRPLLLAALAALFIAALAGTASAAHRSRTTSAKGPQPASAAEWKKLIAKAKSEGSVTLYSVQSPTGLQDMANAFKAKYGISVTVNRNVDSVLFSQINAEEGTHKAIADIWIPSPKRFVYGAVQNGWVVDAVGPSFFAKRFDRKTYMVSKAWIAGSAVLGMTWNTQAYKGTISGVDDFTKPEFKGKIGVPDARVSQSFMDWYLWAEAKWGKSILQKLAAQNPKIYPSVLPMTQAVAAGELAGAPCGSGTAVDLKGQGAPVDYKVLKDNWNAPYFGMILKQAPHPAAAQLLADFMISPEGQKYSDHGFGADYPNIDGTYYAKPRIVKLSDFTPAKVKAFTDQWVSMFVH
jgi:iron(III) transport system substrate-binding protein